MKTTKGNVKPNDSLSRGPRPEEDFHNDDSSDEQDKQKRLNPTGSRPNSGSNSRPTSGTRPLSGTRPHSGSNKTGTGSRPTSATGRPQSVTNRPSSGSNSNVPNNLPTGANYHKHGARDLGVGASNVSLDVYPPKKNSHSPELTSGSKINQIETDSERKTPVKLTSNSVSRMNRKSLREIPKNDARLMKSSEVGIYSIYEFFYFENKMFSLCISFQHQN